MIWTDPMTNFIVTNPYDPTHPATDINHPNGGEGHSVYSMKAGTVIESQKDDRALLATYPQYDRGNYVLVDHGGGELVYYCHLKGSRSPTGPISQDNWLGYVGSTGFTTDAAGNPAYAPHCHIRASRNGEDFDWFKEYSEERKQVMEPTIIDALNLIWDRLDRIQQGLSTNWQDVSTPIQLAEEAKQDGVVEIKKRIGLQ